MAQLTRKQLQELLKENKFKSDLSLMKMQNQLQESIVAFSPGYDLINPFAQFFDGQNLIFPIYPQRLDYRTSSSYIFLSETQLDLLRAYARWLYETNSYAKGALRGLVNFVVKSGFGYEAQPRRDKATDKGLIREVQRFLDEFQQKNKWYIRQKELFLRTRRDGEALIRLFPQDDGIAQVRVVEPETLRSPDATPEWSYGVRTEIEDRETPLMYHILYNASVDSYEDVEPEWIHHIKINVDLGVKRGLSDFFSTQEALANSVKLLRSSTMGSSIRESIAYIREFQQANMTTIQSLQSQNTDYYIPEPSFSGSPRLQPVLKVEPGSVVDVPEGLKFVQPPQSNNDSSVKILQSNLQAMAQFWQMPSWLMTGDSSSASYASSLLEESPFSRMVETEQGFYKEEYKQIMKRVIEIAVSQGDLPEDTLEKIDIQVIVPSVITRQTDKQSQRHMLLHDKKIMSARTWTELEGLEYAHEQSNFTEDEPGFLQSPDILDKPEVPSGEGQTPPSKMPDTDVVRK